MLSPDLFEKWEHLVKNVDKTTVPVEFIKKLVLKLQGRRQRTINIQSLWNQGLEPDEVEEIVARQLNEYEEEIVSIEFIFDIEGIADTVQPHTDEILKGLK
jgi:hypothetical protein